MITQGAYHGDQRVKTPVVGMGVETGNKTLTFTPPAREFFITNDSATIDLSFVLTDQDGVTYSFTVKPGEHLDERYVPFVSVAVNATGGWRWITKSGRIT
jgi:hypothetical protein